MATFEIPLSPEPQTLTISLAGVTYQLRVLWNTFASIWEVDILSSTGVPILTSIPLVTGIDLLGQFGYLNFGGKLYCYTDHALHTPPAYSNLGVTSHLNFETT